MTEAIDIRSRTPATESTNPNFTKHAIEVQSELSKRLEEATRHWLEQAQLASTEGWELFWKIHTTPSVTERIQACQAWAKSAAERISSNASYILDTARTLIAIEM